MSIYDEETERVRAVDMRRRPTTSMEMQSSSFVINLDSTTEQWSLAATDCERPATHSAAQTGRLLFERRLAR